MTRPISGRKNYNPRKFKLEILVEQVLNSALSFIMVREIISTSSISFMSDFNTLVITCYGVVTLLRLFLQRAISMGVLNAKIVLKNIFESTLVKVGCVLAALILAVTLNHISYTSTVLLVVSILAMDFVRYFYLLTGRIGATLAGHVIVVLPALIWSIWLAELYWQPEKVMLIWILLNLTYIIFTLILGLTTKYKSPSNLFVDREFNANFRLILAESGTIQFLQTAHSVGLLLFVPEANAAARIGAQVFLSIPNMLIAATAPFLALYVSKGLISYHYRFYLMLIQLSFFLIPLILIFLPDILLDTLSGSQTRYYLIYQTGLIATGMSFFVISSFSYGYIQIVGGRKYLIYKLSLISSTTFIPFLCLVFSGILLFNIVALLNLCVSIATTKKYLNKRI